MGHNFGSSVTHTSNVNLDVLFLTNLLSSAGAIEIDQILTVLLSTANTVGGITGFILDNLLPGTPEERGIKKWRSLFSEDNKECKLLVASVHTYDIPYITKILQKFTFVKHIPFFPYYGEEIATELNKVESCRKLDSVPS